MAAKRQMAIRWMVVGASAFALAACGGDDSGAPAPGPGSGEPPAAPSVGQWPGGSLADGDWDDGDGVEERWYKDPSAAGDGEDGFSRGGVGTMGPTAESDGDSAGEPAPGPGAPPDASEGGGAGGGGGAVGPGFEPEAPPAGGLEGGEIDDNDDLAGFLDYAERMLEQFGADPSVHWLEVSRRHVITVRDRGGNTVPDATVAIFEGDRDEISLEDIQDDPVAWGRTRADGRFAFFPGAYGSDADDYTAYVVADGLRTAVTFDREADDVDAGFDAHRAPDATFRVDVAFIIDATGSMGEEIDRIKQTVSDIAGRIAESEFSPDLRFALVDYRDFGDAYVVHTVNFTRDVQAFQGAIDQLEAGGGGDGPEALNEALHEGMRRLEWRREATLRLTFVVADAPAHHYDQAPYTYDAAMLDAAAMGVKIFPIASGGSDGVAELQFRQLAQFTQAHFIFVTEGGGSSSGSGGSDYNVDPEAFRVEALDALVVRLVTEEMEAWHQATPPI